MANMKDTLVHHFYFRGAAVAESSACKDLVLYCVAVVGLFYETVHNPDHFNLKPIKKFIMFRVDTCISNQIALGLMGVDVSAFASATAKITHNLRCFDLLSVFNSGVCGHKENAPLLAGFIYNHNRQ